MNKQATFNWHCVRLVLPFLGLFCSTAIAGGELALLEAPERWQMNRLFEPQAGDLTREDKGQIIIYDGLQDSTVDRALDQHFDRIQNMMFTRVVVTGADGYPLRDTHSGQVVVEDDGC